MIIQYEHSNIKGFSNSIELKPVTVVCGPNRSSKSAHLEGLALAATGKALLGASAQKIGKLIGRSGDSASSTIRLSSGQSAQWAIKQTMKDGKVSYKSGHDIPDKDFVEDVFGNFITPSQFWELTGEQKFQEIGKLVEAQNDVSSTLSEICKVTGEKAVGGDIISAMTSLAKTLKTRIDNLQEKRDSTSQSLNPPEEYTGEPLEILILRRQEVERFISDQRKAMADNAQMAARRSRINEELQELTERIANKEPAIAAQESEEIRYREGVERIAQFAWEIRQATESMTSEMLPSVAKAFAECQGAPVLNVLTEQLSAAYQHISTAIGLSRSLGITIGNHGVDAIESLDLLGEHIEKEVTVKFGTESMPRPEQCAEIDKILETLPTKWRPTSIEDYSQAEMFLKHDLTVMASASNKASAELSRLKEQLAKLEAEAKIIDATTIERCSSGDFAEKVELLELTNCQIEKAQEWPAFIKRREEATKQIADIDDKLCMLKEQDTKLRFLRTHTLNSSCKPVEDEANKLIVAMGLQPLALAITSTDKQSSLTIETLDGVELSTMCGTEKVVYGLALLRAIHELSDCVSPLRLVECAELDADSLEKLIDALNDIGGKGNTVIATWLNPLRVPVDVHVVDCGVKVA